jgi:nitrogen fixation/metabolism regulation signal transduction histidine kinase
VSLRRRFLAAFLLVAALPVAALALLVERRVARAYDESARERLLTALDVTRRRLDQLRARAEAQTTAVATLDLPASPGSADLRELVESLGARRDLPALELVESDGRILASRHWPAGIGLEDADAAFAGTSFRLEKSASGFGSALRLAIVAERRSTWSGRPILVRGGAFLDGDVAAELGRTADCRLAFYDAARGAWTAPPDSPLVAFRPSGAPPGGTADAALDGKPWRFTTTSVAPALLLVAALPRDDLDRVLGDVRGDTVAAAGLALGLAALAAVLVAGRLARPIRDLANGAGRIARGDFDASVQPQGGDELGALARAFNTMAGDLRTSRERLVQAERVAAWREMARRLAHELKNPIFPIQVSLDTLGRALERDPASFPDLFRASSATIRQELQALKRIVEEFSEFARMPRPRPRPTDLNAVAAQALALHRDRAPGVHVEAELAEGLPPVTVDPDLLGRALSNLVANAFEAMPEGGTLSLRSRADGDHVEVEVEDTGPGLSEEQRTRLFAPYFTTKRGGTGLGLAIVQGIVSDHGGRVDVRSAAGRGTTFTLSLPVSGRMAAPSGQE